MTEVVHNCEPPTDVVRFVSKQRIHNTWWIYGIAHWCESFKKGTIWPQNGSNSQNLWYKPRPDLHIYKANQLESTFAEIINPKKSNIATGCLYKHPNMDVLDLKITILAKFLKLYQENKNRYFFLVTLIQIFWITMIINQQMISQIH